MTRKDYVLLARVIRETLAEGPQYVDVATMQTFIHRLGYALTVDNPQFDYKRFYAAIVTE